MAGLLWSLALMAFVSLNPYFMWGYQKVYYAVASSLLVLSFMGCSRMLSPTRFQLALCAAFSLFLMYLSLLPKVEGAPTRWFFLIPYTVALLALSRENLTKTFDNFYWIFALSLIPGMLLWIWLVAGLPIEMNYLTLPPGARRGTVHYFGLPGAIFISSNAVILPSGGVVFRLCGIYDEPGTVGTIAALCLAATRFRLREARGAISLVAGILSFSLAFAVLTTLGLLGMAIAGRRPKLAVAALATILAGAVIVSGVTFERAPTTAPNLTITVPSSDPARGEDVQTKSTPERFNLDYRSHLRSLRIFNSRIEPEMLELLDKYASSSPRTILFGVASDASIVYGSESVVWYRILTDHGLIGFIWLVLLYSLPVVFLWRAGRLDLSVVVFCTLYLMSFYQRPVIWLPAQVLIYFAGIYWAAASRPRGADALRSG
ncbi:MAG TPA: hypothetical protein VKF40_19385 [Burkholderiales bacterium]|nr:hypothetical protein [Burkholderiales bacterium]